MCCRRLRAVRKDHPVHLTPEQIDRQPFKMTRRGYDIVQVRNFLREVAAEMRARQEVRQRLAEEGDDTAVAEDRAHSMIAEAQAQADVIVEEAKAKAGSLEVLLSAESRAAEIVGSAEALSDQLIEEAEATARTRSDEVLSATQARLDQLLEEERALHARVEALRFQVAGPEVETSAIDARDLVSIDRTPDSSLADLLKSTVREEVNLD